MFLIVFALNNEEPKISHASKCYSRDFDGLRAIAVLRVVFCHAGSRLPSRYVRVDVFFVILGYLITDLILLRLCEKQLLLSSK